MSAPNSTKNIKNQKRNKKNDRRKGGKKKAENNGKNINEDEIKPNENI